MHETRRDPCFSDLEMSSPLSTHTISITSRAMNGNFHDLPTWQPGIGECAKPILAKARGM